MKSTDWLIRGISEKKLKREQKRAERKARRKIKKIVTICVDEETSFSLARKDGDE